MKAAECHALKKPKKQGKWEERSEAERKTPGNEVVFWWFCALIFNKMSKKRFPAARKGQQRREALPKNNQELPGLTRRLLHGDPRV